MGKKQRGKPKTLHTVLDQVICKNSKPESGVRSRHSEQLGARLKANSARHRLGGSHQWEHLDPEVPFTPVRKLSPEMTITFWGFVWFFCGGRVKHGTQVSVVK